MVLVALYVQLVHNPTGDQSLSDLILVELAATAGGGIEGPGGDRGCFYIENGVPIVSCGSIEECCWERNEYLNCDWTGSPTDWCKPYV